MPPQKTRIVLSHAQVITGAAPMYAKRLVNIIGPNFIKKIILNSIVPAGQTINALLPILKMRVDIAAGYNTNDNTSTSAQLGEQIFHELTHAAHYSKVGNQWYAQFVFAEYTETILDGILSGERPYGDGTRAGSSYIGLGESWAYYIGHVLTNTKYATANMFVFEQGIAYQNNTIHNIVGNTITGPVATTGLNAHLNLLEDFSPVRANDPFRWIPQGLFYDMADDRNDRNALPRRIDLEDEVLNYSSEMFFNALDNDITTIPEYRVRLLNENNNNQFNGVNTIFNFYGY